MKKKNLIPSLALATTMAISSIAPAFAYGSVDTVSGPNRVETSIQTMFKNTTNVDTLVIASARSFADSLSSVNLIIKYPNSKLLLVDKNTDISNVLQKAQPSKIYLIGGDDTLNGKFMDNIRSAGINYERIAGNSRYDTNKLTLEGFDEVGVADGRNYPDALSASALLKNENLGLMLVNGSKDYQTDKTVRYTFGGSVSKSAGIRLAGSNRYKTNEEINSMLGSKTHNIITYGENYADALSAVNLIENNEKIVLLKNSNISSYNKSLIKDGSNTVVGGLLNPTLPTLNAISKNEPLPTPTPTPSPNVISTQRQLDNYIVDRFLNGISENGESVAVKNISDISQALKYVLMDVGFQIDSNVSNGRYHYKVAFDRIQGSYSYQTYNKADFMKNINRIKNDIRNSGATNQSSRKDKNEVFARYIIRNYRYKYINDESVYKDSSSPYSLTFNRTASCKGFTYQHNLACMLMKIPAFMVIGDNDKGYHAESQYLDEYGNYNTLNITGYVNSYPNLSDWQIDLSPTITKIVIKYSGKPNDYDYLNRRHKAMYSNFYN